MLLEILRPIFERKYEIVKNHNNKKVADDVIKVMDFLASKTITEIREPSYFKINALLYTFAVTAKEHLNDLKKIPKQRLKKAPPKWLDSIESKKKKKIGQLTTLINCKNTGNFTNDQKEIKQKFYNKYGNTRM